MPRPNRAERELLNELIQYLNLAEMRAFCKEHDLPLYIHAERPDGGLRRTQDRDRKDVVLARIQEFALLGRRTGPTVYAANVISPDPLPRRLTSRTRVHYGQYEKKNPEFLRKMRDLTEGNFETGMIARLVLRDFWTRGHAPTLAEFARAWSSAKAAHTQPRPEGAYLADLARGTAGSDWKQTRVRKARQALRMLARILET